MALELGSYYARQIDQLLYSVQDLNSLLNKPRMCFVLPICIFFISVIFAIFQNLLYVFLEKVSELVYVSHFMYIFMYCISIFSFKSIKSVHVIRSSEAHTNTEGTLAKIEYIVYHMNRVIEHLYILFIDRSLSVFAYLQYMTA